MDTVLIIILIVILAGFYYFWYLEKSPDFDFIQSLIENYKKNNPFSPFEDGNNQYRPVNNYLSNLISESTPEFLKSKFIYESNHYLIFQSELSEWKVFPLCCNKCKLRSLMEIKFNQLLEKEAGIPKIIKTWVSEKIPTSLNYARFYLIIEREKTDLLVQIPENKQINFKSLENLLKLICLIHKNYEKVFSLTINDIGLNQSGDLLLINYNSIPYNYKTNIYNTPFSIITRIKPELFGNYKNTYLNIQNLVENNKFSIPELK